MEEKGEIVIYQTQDGITKLDVRLDGDTVWLSQEQMAQLFERDKSVITRHISNIYAEGELSRESTSAKIAFVPQTRERCTTGRPKAYRFWELLAPKAQCRVFF